jgi:hypothetical protein
MPLSQIPPPKASPQMPGIGFVELLVNVMESVAVPSAIKSELLNSRPTALSNLTVTPGSMVNVSPGNTTTFPVTMYGLLARLQVVFA